MVQASNEVCIYSPRFGAVRQVVGAVANTERQKATGVYEPIQSSSPQSTQFVAGAKQNIQPTGEAVANPAVALRTKQGDEVVSNAIGPRGFQDRFKAYENLAILRQGMFQNTDMLLLARGSTAAIAWSQIQSVQIMLDRQNATADVKYDQATSLYTVGSPPGTPRLQLVKVASTPFAKPGEEVDFTLRFDNIGNETINHVAIRDSLSTRLEYVPDSARVQCRRHLLDAAERGRVPRVAMRIGQAAGTRPRRHPPLPLPRPLAGSRSVVPYGPMQIVSSRRLTAAGMCGVAGFLCGGRDPPPPKSSRPVADRHNPLRSLRRPPC